MSEEINQEQQKDEEISTPEKGVEEVLPESLKVFLESELFKNARQSDGSVKFPTHIHAIKKAYDQLRKSVKK